MGAADSAEGGWGFPRVFSMKTGIKKYLVPSLQYFVFTAKIYSFG